MFNIKHTHILIPISFVSFSFRFGHNTKKLFKIFSRKITKVVFWVCGGLSAIVEAFFLKTLNRYSNIDFKDLIEH